MIIPVDRASNLTTEEKLLSLRSREGTLTNVEYQEVQQILVECQRDYDEIENQRCTVDCIHAMALEVLSPIHRLPDEILGEIFCHASYTGPIIFSGGDYHRVHPSHSSSPYIAPFVLFRVCKHWRNVTFKTPGVFRQLVIPDNSPLDFNKVIPIWLHHSRTLPFEIHISLGSSFERSNPGAKPETLHQIIPHVHRLTSLGLSWAQLSSLLPAGTSLEAPVLRTLDLSDERSWLMQSASFGSLLAPKLNKLYIMGDKQWTGFLKYNPHALNQFCLVNDQKPMRPLEVLSFLTQHPNMESYDIHLADFDVDEDGNVDEPEDEDELPLVNHLSLTSLSIRHTFLDTIGLECLLPYLRAPKLKILKITPENDYEIRNDLPTISNFAIVSNMALRTLVLHFNRLGAVHQSAFKNLMCSLPSLEKLRFNYGNLAHFLSVLDRTLHPDILPSLVSLRLYDCIAVPGDILAVLRSRTVPCRLSLLKEIKCARLRWREYGQSMRLPLKEISQIPQGHSDITIRLIKCLYEDEEKNPYLYDERDYYDSDDDFSHGFSSVQF